MTTPAPAAPNAPQAKTCVRCGTDCNGKPRVKDQQGRYTCQPCVDKLHAQRAASKPSQGGGAPHGAAVAEPSEPEGFDVFDIAPDPAAPKVAPCPNCGKPVNEQAAVCVGCGYSKQLGRVLKPSDTPRTEDLPRGKRIECKKCGYDLRGLKTAKCPECGTINTNPSRRDRDRENSAAAAREAYLKPLIYFVVGFLGVCLIQLTQFGPGAVVLYGIGYAIQVPIGVAVFWVCCLVWIGFDAPIHLTALRLAGIYALVDLAGSILGFIPIMGGAIGWIVSLFIYVGLLMDMLEMDLQDTVIVALLTSLVKTVIAIFVIVAIANAF